MYWILTASGALFAIAFFIFTIYSAVTMMALKKTMQEISGTVKGLEDNLKSIALETEMLLNKTNALASDVEKKLSSLDTFFDLVEDLGKSAIKFKSSLSNFASFGKKSHDEDLSTSESFAKVFVPIALKAVNVFMKRKKNKNEVDTHE